MKGPSARIWLASLACSAILFGAVAWVSATVIGLERSRERMRQEAWVEENVRLSLWRMDSAVAPLLARESGRAAGDFARAGTLDTAEPYVRQRFQFSVGGSPSNENPALVIDAGMGATITRERVIGALASAEPAQAKLAMADPSAPDSRRRVIDYVNERAASLDMPQVQALQQAQLTKSANEYAQRSWSIGNVYANSMSGAIDGNVDQERDGLPAARAVPPMTAVWLDEQLILARRVETANGDAVQGSWIDWPALERSLLASVADLLPAAELVRAAKEGDPTRTLVSLPVVVRAGALPNLPASDSAVVWILIAVWCAVLLAAGAAIALIAGVSALSERRAAFVAAVTHELRTPLTTLQTYSEMLADGKIKDEPKRERYVRTLHRESVRLGHLVENVLSYSRIERGRSGMRRDRVSARALLERARERLGERAAGAGLVLRLDLPESSGALEFVGDRSAVEQIVFNLVDNAAKYAVDVEQPYIDVSARARGGSIEIQVRDHGPGVPGDVRKRLFKPFSKSVEQAAVSAPGVGLGLALGQRLARAMGGRLAFDSSTASGACFVLRLPAAAPTRAAADDVT